MRLSVSAVTTYQRCPREWHLSRTRVPRTENESLRVGRAYHALLDRLWRGELPETTDATLLAMAAASAELWGGIPPKDLPVVAVEEPFELELERHAVTGRIDAIVSMSGDLLVVEHKTASSYDGVVWGTRLMLALQPAVYCAAVGCRDVLYDVAVKPRIRPKTGETDEAFAARLRESCKAYLHHRTLTADDIGRALDRVEAWGDRMAADHSWPQATEACVRYFSACPYLPVCGGYGDIGDDTVYRDKEETK